MRPTAWQRGSRHGWPWRPTRGQAQVPRLLFERFWIEGDEAALADLAAALGEGAALERVDRSFEPPLFTSVACFVRNNSPEGAGACRGCPRDLTLRLSQGSNRFVLRVRDCVTRLYRDPQSFAIIGASPQSGAITVRRTDMKPEDRSKLQSYLSEISGLKSREPEEKKCKEWRENVEKKLEEVFGKGSGEAEGFKRIRFFDFNRAGKSKDVPLTESERREYLAVLDSARRYLQRFV